MDPVGRIAYSDYARSIPTVIAPAARRALVGLTEAAAYRALMENAASP
jgi:hypothetical protein